MNGLPVPLGGGGLLGHFEHDLRWQTALLVSVALLLIAAAWTSVVLIAASEREAEIKHIERGNLHLARALEEHTLAVLQRADQAANFLSRRYLELGGKIPINDYIRNREIAAEHLVQVGIIDADGMYRYGSIPIEKPLDLSDREHFRVHVAADTGKLFVSRPVLGRASGKWSIQLSRRITDAKGGFVGVVVLSLDPEYLSSLYADLMGGNRGVISLVGADGLVRARRATGGEPAGQDLSRTPLMLLASRRTSGSYASVSVIDGESRLYSFRRVAGYPLNVVVGVNREDALAANQTRMRGYFVAAGLFTAFVLTAACLAWFLLRRMRRNLEDADLARRAAEQAGEAKSMFLANMSHELRTPLNVIMGSAELLLEEGPGGKLGPIQRRSLERIDQSSIHLLALIDDVLDMAKLQADRIVPQISSVDIAAVCADCIDSVTLAAAKKRIGLSSSNVSSLPLIESDARWLRQILLNLLGNAIKFTPDGGRVRLDVSDRGGSVEFAVSDTGIGIAAEAQARLFKPFVQVDQGLSRRFEGNGLGLALSKGLAERLGGTLSVQSTPGEGSTFTLALPRGTQAQDKRVTP